ncbi:ER membrane protein DP1/Yop1 [Coemansia sp. RSA 2706]|nr:ER membrane protein DP1/Yop1 [Coemansia sp. RSA 2706]
MEQAHGIFNRYYNVADAHLARIPAAQSFQAKTGVPKVYGAAGVASIGLLLVFLNVGASLLVNLTGFGYAGNDDAQWLTYWVVFGLFNVVEYFTGFLLYWFPFYYLIKLGFLVWLMLPATRGAERLYHAGIKPVLQQARAHHAAAPAQPTSSAKAAEPKSD